MSFSVKSINHPAHLLSQVSLLPWRSKLANELVELPPLWAGRVRGGVASNSCHLLVFVSLITYLKHLSLSFTLWGHSQCTCNCEGFWFSSNRRREVTIEEVNLTLYWKVCHRTKQNKKAQRHAKEGRNPIRKMNTIDKQMFPICGLFFISPVHLLCPFIIFWNVKNKEGIDPSKNTSVCICIGSKLCGQPAHHSLNMLWGWVDVWV